MRGLYLHLNEFYLTMVHLTEEYLDDMLGLTMVISRELYHDYQWHIQNFPEGAQPII